jgi:hypothetical protein
LFTIVKVEHILAAFPSGWKKRAKSLLEKASKIAFRKSEQNRF